ncbi:MAG: DUF563 domain-containing protein [Alphaproteobacteria bacterium]|nr:DUF563 domain-containing protein [Alphaproteobacteria bacterium]
MEQLLSNGRHEELCRLMTVVYAYHRYRGPFITNPEHRLSPLKFIRISERLLAAGAGADLRPGFPSYLVMVVMDAFRSTSYSERFVTSPVLFAWLYYAEMMKFQGLFEDAEYLYRELSKHDAVRDLALLGMSDLLLIQALWADEFGSYEQDGIVVNTFKHLPRMKKVATWHQMRFEAALTLLESATREGPTNPDAWWLLSFGAAHAGEWKRALDALRVYTELTGTSFEASLQKVKIQFCLDPEEGLRNLSELTRTSLGYMSAERAQVVPVHTLREASGVQLHDVNGPLSYDIKAHLISFGDVVPLRSNLQFGPTSVARYETADIIPEYGIILANDKFLIEETTHHTQPIHISIFNSKIISLCLPNALIWSEVPVDIQSPNCIYFGHNANYYHWLLDELPRLMLVEACPEFANAHVLVDLECFNRPWQISSLRRIGIGDDRLRAVSFNKRVRFRNLIVPSHLSCNMVAHPEAVRFMRRRLVPHADEMSARPGKRLFLRRASQSVAGRSMLNDDEVYLQFQRANFTFVDTGQMSIDEQIDLFADAEIIASQGGAALTNALFAPRDCKIVTLCASNALAHTFTSVASALGQEHWIVVGPSFGSRLIRHWIWSIFDFEILPRDLDLCFKHIL